MTFACACGEDPLRVCACSRCSREPNDEKFYSCLSCLSSPDGGKAMKAHSRVRGRVAVWAELPWTPFLEGDFTPEHRAIYEAHPGYIGVFLNSRYQVLVREQETPIGKVTWLACVRRDRSTIRDWRELQLIKNELVGREREACEVFPAESRLVDTNNQYHLFVLPEGFSFPFGYAERDVIGQAVAGSAHKQRPFEIPPEEADPRAPCDFCGAPYQSPAVGVRCGKCGERRVIDRE